MQSVRRAIVKTPLAAQPREIVVCGIRWQGTNTQVEHATQQDVRANGSRVGGDPSDEDRRSADPGGDRAPEKAASPMATWEPCPHRTSGTTRVSSLGLVGDPGVILKMEPARTEADAITIPGLPAPSQFRHWKLSLRDEAAEACVRTPDEGGAWNMETEAPGGDLGTTQR